MKLARRIFEKHWNKETSYSDNWESSNPSIGQCAISALTFQDIFEGEICKIKVNNNESHYFNLISDNIYDLTADQFHGSLNYNDKVVVDRETILKNKETNDRYLLFKNSVFKELKKKLPKKEIEHISIRVPNYVAGSDKKPEVKVFCQTNASRKPLNDNLLTPGQNVYMKWTGGPIVATSKLVSWHSGKFENGNINKVRELTLGTNLFGLTDYWDSVSIKGNGNYTVTHLTDEKWIDNILYPATKSFGSSWVYLDTLEKKLKWLSLDHEPIKEKVTGRTIPSRIRFNVLKRDNFTCQYCGRKAPDVELHIDHIIPWSKVKEHKIENLQVACSDCNLGKSDKLLNE